MGRPVFAGPTARPLGVAAGRTCPGSTGLRFLGRPWADTVRCVASPPGRPARRAFGDGVVVHCEGPHGALPQWFCTAQATLYECLPVVHGLNTSCRSEVGACCPSRGVWCDDGGLLGAVTLTASYRGVGFPLPGRPTL